MTIRVSIRRETTTDIKLSAGSVRMEFSKSYGTTTTYRLFIERILLGDYTVLAANREDKESVIHGLFIGLFI